MPKRISIAVGTQIKDWTVIKEVGICNNSRQKKFLCKCKCGKEQILLSANLRNLTSSFRCLQCTKSIISKKVTKHGYWNSRIHNIWRTMLSRCYKPNNIAYHNYGGRGITVCERWHKFENFLADMGQPPKGLQIDRIDLDGNYEPSNCRWVTASENNKNKRNSIKNRDKYTYVLKSRLCETCSNNLS